MTVFATLALKARREAHVWRRDNEFFASFDPQWKCLCESKARERFKDAHAYLRLERELRERTQ